MWTVKTHNKPWKNQQVSIVNMQLQNPTHQNRQNQVKLFLLILK